jgi:hypothetical protein
LGVARCEARGPRRHGHLAATQKATSHAYVTQQCRRAPFPVRGIRCYVRVAHRGVPGAGAREVKGAGVAAAAGGVVGVQSDAQLGRKEGVHVAVRELELASKERQSSLRLSWWWSSHVWSWACRRSWFEVCGERRGQPDTPRKAGNNCHGLIPAPAFINEGCPTLFVQY